MLGLACFLWTLRIEIFSFGLHRVLLFWSQWCSMPGNSFQPQNICVWTICYLKTVGPSSSAEYSYHWEWGEEFVELFSTFSVLAWHTLVLTFFVWTLLSQLLCRLETFVKILQYNPKECYYLLKLLTPVVSKGIIFYTITVLALRQEPESSTKCIEATYSPWATMFLTKEWVRETFYSCFPSNL